MILKIGPFDLWSEAVTFLNLWSDKTRGKSRRLERGLELFAMYGHVHNLCLWGQSETQEEILQKEAQQPPRKRTKKRLVPRIEKPKKPKLANSVEIEWTRAEICDLFGQVHERDTVEKLRLMHETVGKGKFIAKQK